MKTRQDGIRTVQDIKDRCRVDEITGCWNWAGAMKKKAPRCWIPGIGAASMTMTLQWVLNDTKPTGARMLVPTCGNVGCGNPAHRSWGTRSELFVLVTPPMSMQHKARMVAAKRAASTVCSPNIANEIRLSDESAGQISKRLGIHLTHVCRIRRGEAWATTLPGSSVFAMGAAG